MFCPQCGRQLQASSRLCSTCGASTTTAHPSEPILRPLTNRMIAGVCAALALHYGWSVHRVRLVTVLLTLFSGVGALAYLAAWIVIPQETYPVHIKTTQSR
jgi:phage shock protein C